MLYIRKRKRWVEKNTSNLLNTTGLMNPNKTSAAFSGVSRGHSQNTSLCKLNYYYTLSSKPGIICLHLSVIYDTKWPFFFYNLGQGNNYCSWMNCEATFISDWSSPVTTQAGEAETPAHAHVQLWPGWRTRRPAGTGTAGSRPGRKSCWTQRQGKPERAP